MLRNYIAPRLKRVSVKQTYCSWKICAQHNRFCRISFIIVEWNANWSIFSNLKARVLLSRFGFVGMSVFRVFQFFLSVLRKGCNIFLNCLQLAWKMPDGVFDKSRDYRKTVRNAMRALVNPLGYIFFENRVSKHTQPTYINKHKTSDRDIVI